MHTCRPEKKVGAAPLRGVPGGISPLRGTSLGLGGLLTRERCLLFLQKGAVWKRGLSSLSRANQPMECGAQGPRPRPTHRLVGRCLSM